ncbi:hypothetical protein [Litorihabitans aurantiacus]|uniref:Uncharacterized protein n=1 Tax=Litorihabitans aurantiacus TaxID=1930061 RepID=A0AA37XHQ9_9MICO|nr:hypothetical protein [Litorihabitans aurantiacus]GMA33359.1 hypothetical protein GCM10025875_33510 [Litorihabitans aurantiacus]
MRHPGPRIPARVLPAALAVVLTATALAACRQDVAPPTGADAVCGDPVAADDVTLEGLAEADVLLVESSLGLTDTVVYDDGRVAVVGRTAGEWSRGVAGMQGGDGEAAVGRDGDRSGGLTTTVTAVGTVPPSGGHASRREQPAAGTVVVPALAWMPHPESPLLLVGRLPDCALDDLARLAADLRDVVERTNGDLGSPMVTDMVSTRLDYRGDAAVNVSAYALGFDDDLRREQREGRAFMRAMQDVVVANLPDVVEVEPEAFERYPSPSADCEAITDPEEVAAILAIDRDADDADLDPLAARPVPAGIVPCG